MKSILTVGVLLTCALVSIHSWAFRQDEYAIEISPASANLSQGSVLDIFQDSNDFIWLVTQEGLNRFDGREVVAFKTDRADSSSINNQATTTIAEDGEGRVWVGTLGGGLSRFNEADLTFTSYEALPSISSNNPVSNMISSLQTSLDGSMWVGYADGSGFSRFEPNDELFVHYFLPNQIPSAQVEGFVETTEGTLYIAVDGGGMYRMDTATGIVKDLEKETASGSTALPKDVSDIALLESGKLLITSKTMGAFLYEPSERLASRHPVHTATQADTANQILTAFEDTDGNHWFGTESGIVVYSKSGSATWLTSVNTQLPNTAVLSFMQSKSGMLWIGTFSGLAQGTRSLFQKFTEDDGLSSSLTFSILTDELDNWWIGTSRGISAFKPVKDLDGAWKLGASRGTLLEDYLITSIQKYGSMLYAGTFTAGFFEIDLESKTIMQFTADGGESSLSNNGVPVLRALSDGRILVGTFGGGLNIYDPKAKAFESFTSHSSDLTSISDDRVISILIDSNEQIWVGTQDGLNLFDLKSSTFRRFKSDPQDTSTLSSNRVYSLAEDQQNVLWIGTNSGDLDFLPISAAKSESPEFQQLPPSVGVPTSDVLGIVVDSGDNIWASHNLGITRIDKSRQKSESFDVTAGLQGREFNQGSAHVSEDGSLVFFGGVNGFNVIEPSESYADTYEPKIQITSFKLLNEQIYFDVPYSKLNTVSLDYDYQFASVSFAALDYRRPDAIGYRYRIDGIHNEWINLGQARSVSISGLGYGTYKLRLSSTNSSGRWSETGREITLNIASPWWLTWYAYVAYAAIIIYIIFFIFKQQQAKSKIELARRLELEERVKERTHDLQLARNEAEAAAKAKSEFLAAMSHEIRTPMHGMIGMTDLLIQSGLNVKQKSYALTARDSGESLLAIINSILDYSKMEADKLELDLSEFDIVSLIDNVATLLMQNALAAKTELHVVWTNCDSRLVHGDAGKIRQILVNLIGNAIKFTKGGTVIVWCSISPSQKTIDSADSMLCQISVEDNGIGIATEKLDSVFEVFTQADASTTRQYGGTGLGLSISKELAELMNGTLSVTSKLGAGSKFTFESTLKSSSRVSSRKSGELKKAICATGNDLVYQAVKSKLRIAGYGVERLGVVANLQQLRDLPQNVIIDQDIWDRLSTQDNGHVENLVVLCRDNATLISKSAIRAVPPPFTQSDLIVATEVDPDDDVNAEQSEISAKGFVTGRILVVEDVLVNQQIAMTMLNSLGAQVDLADNGEEAVILFEKTKYDLIFMDCQMPVLDGYGATSKIRKIEQASNAPKTTIIALTAGGDQDDKQRAYDAGMDGFLTKPFTTSDLRQALDKLDLMHETEPSIRAVEKNTELKDTQASQNDVLDLDVVTSLKSLSNDGKNELIPQLLSGFSTQFEQKLTELEECIAERDREKLRTIAHAVKSMSANMGASQIRKAAEEMEKGFLEFNFGERAEVVGELQSLRLAFLTEAENFFYK